MYRIKYSNIQIFMHHGVEIGPARRERSTTNLDPPRSSGCLGWISWMSGVDILDVWGGYLGCLGWMSWMTWIARGGDIEEGVRGDEGLASKEVAGGRSTRIESGGEGRSLSTPYPIPRTTYLPSMNRPIAHPSHARTYTHTHIRTYVLVVGVGGGGGGGPRRRGDVGGVLLQIHASGMVGRAEGELGQWTDRRWCAAIATVRWQSLHAL